nr:transposase [Roseomonas acroporae]
MPASVQERDALPALDAGVAAWPSLRVALFDGGFVARRCHDRCDRHGLRHDVVHRPKGRKGFAVLPRRWGVERSFGWLSHWGGLLRDRAGRLDVAAARLAAANVLAAAQALRNPVQTLSNRLRELRVP